MHVPGGAGSAGAVCGWSPVFCNLEQSRLEEIAEKGQDKGCLMPPWRAPIFSSHSEGCLCKHGISKLTFTKVALERVSYMPLY